MAISELYSLAGPCGAVIIVIGIWACFTCARVYFYTLLVWKDFKKNFVEKNSRELSLKDYTGTNPFIRIIYQMSAKHRGHSDDWKSEVVYLFNKNFKNVINSLAILKMITVISPLLGLLGTVLGMLNVFDAISSATSEDPRLLAHGIWQALITTVLGLVVAIPSLVMYYSLTVRVKVFLMEALEYTYQTLSFLDNLKAENHSSGLKNNKNTDDRNVINTKISGIICNEA